MSITARSPVELRMIDQASCFANVVAQLMYVWRRTEYPNVAQASHAISRKPGQPQTLLPVQYYLLEQGFALHEVSDWDGEAFVRDGERYLRRYFGRGYREATEGVDLQSIRDLTIANAPYRLKGQLISEVKTPSANQVRKLLADGWTVIVELRVTEEDQAHIGLLLPRYNYPNGSAVWVYDPQLHRKTVYMSSFANAMRGVDLTIFGFTAVRLN